jgi:hypothetical protein
LAKKHCQKNAKLYFFQIQGLIPLNFAFKNFVQEDNTTLFPIISKGNQGIAGEHIFNLKKGGAAENG